MRTALHPAIATTALLVLGTHPAWGAAGHPFDALTAAEITAAATLLRNTGHADAQTLFTLIGLEEPPKDAVLALEARRSDPACRDRRAAPAGPDL